MKKISNVLSVLIITTLLLIGCGQVSGTCDVCKSDAKLWKLSVCDKDNSSNSTTQLLCEDCLKDAEDFWDKMISAGFDYITYSSEKYTGK